MYFTHLFSFYNKLSGHLNPPLKKKNKNIVNISYSLHELSLLFRRAFSALQVWIIEGSVKRTVMLLIVTCIVSVISISGKKIVLNNNHNIFIKIFGSCPVVVRVCHDHDNVMVFPSFGYSC